MNVAWSDGRLKGYEYNSIPNPNVKSQTAKSPASKAKKGDTPQEKGDLFTSCASEAAHFCRAGAACRAPRLPNKMSCASTLTEERSDPSEAANFLPRARAKPRTSAVQAMLAAPRGNQKDVVRQHAYRGALATPAKWQNVVPRARAKPRTSAEQALPAAPRGNQKDVVRQHAYRGAERACERSDPRRDKALTASSILSHAHYLYCSYRKMRFSRGWFLFYSSAK